MGRNSKTMVKTNGGKRVSLNEARIERKSGDYAAQRRRRAALAAARNKPVSLDPRDWEV